MWQLEVIMSGHTVRKYQAETWQEIDKIFATLAMLEEHAEPQGSIGFLIMQIESTDTPGQDKIGA